MRPALIVTGGIGSGKSALVEALGWAGWDTVDADTIGHLIIQPGTAANAEVAARWPFVTQPDGRIDRKALAAIVFTDRRELAALEEITHPAIRAALVERLQSEGPTLAIDLSVPAVLASDPLLKELPVVVVDAPVELRRRRLAARGLDEADIANRISAQPTRGEWLRLADLVVPNHGDLIALRRSAGFVSAWLRSRWG